MAENKRITLHPLKKDGTIDTDINLYPKTLLDGIVDREGEEVEVALKSDIPTDYATKEYVDNSKGTKLYSHHLVVSSTQGSLDFYVISFEGTNQTKSTTFNYPGSSFQNFMGKALHIYAIEGNPSSPDCTPLYLKYYYEFDLVYQSGTSAGNVGREIDTITDTITEL